MYATCELSIFRNTTTIHTISHMRIIKQLHTPMNGKETNNIAVINGLHKVTSRKNLAYDTSFRFVTN